jgi:transcriptional regulator with XRE-family HTH domain
MNIKDIILRSFPSESAFARRLGWSRQRLNKITNLDKSPTVQEINEIAVGLGRSASEIYLIFLNCLSPNG